MCSLMTHDMFEGQVMTHSHFASHHLSEFRLEIKLQKVSSDLLSTCAREL